MLKWSLLGVTFCLVLGILTNYFLLKSEGKLHTPFFWGEFMMGVVAFLGLGVLMSQIPSQTGAPLISFLIFVLVNSRKE